MSSEADNFFARLADIRHFETGHRTLVRRCPKCAAWAYYLWQMYGLTYFKCGHCGHKGPNL